MRITNNTVSESIVSQIQQLGSQQAKYQTQVATGQRIFQPEDDPASVGRVLDLQSEQRKIAQFQNNAARALEISQASFSGLQAIKQVSDRAGEIATLGSGSFNPSQLQAYGSEVNQLIEQTLQSANSKFGTDYLYAGTKLDTAPFVATRDAQGNITNVTYAGDLNRSSIPLSETASVSAQTTGTTNTGLRDFINQLVALRDALNSGNAAAVTTTQAGLQSSEDVVVDALAEHGGVQARIEANKDQQTDRLTDLEKLISGETDADLPTTIVKLQQTQTAYQAALQSGASIMRLSLLDYIK